MEHRLKERNYWAFLHTRNRIVDYSFALLPGFLIGDRAAQSRLGKELRGEPGEEGHATLEVGDSTYLVFFTIKRAHIDGAEARDPAGRTIALSSGVISEVGVGKDVLRRLDEEAAGEVETAWRRFWGEGRRPIIESTARSTAEEFSPKEAAGGNEARTGERATTVRGSSTPEPIKVSGRRKSAGGWVVANVVLGLLCLALLALWWGQAASRAKMEDRVKGLEADLRRAQVEWRGCGF